MLFRLIPAIFFATALFAESATPSLRFTGAPSDGGRDCSACHNTFLPNSDLHGGVSMDITEYNPGVAQTIHVRVNHPSATRWGFQLTARSVSDETKQAGSFAAAGSNVQARCDDGSRFGTVPPCNNGFGQRQFAEHLDAPRTAAGAGFEFDVMWMPPSPEIGKVTFYLAAVAADGDGTPGGDHVYTISRTVNFTGSCPITKKPTLRTAVNAASFDPGISSNAMITIFGAGFTDGGTKRTAALGDFDNGAFPRALSCVAVEFSGPGLPGPVRVPVTYVQQDQINVQAPAFSGTGPVNLVVIINPDKPNEIRSDLATLNSLQPFAPAFFTFDGKSVAAQFANSANVVARPGVVAGGNPAKPGDIVTLYGTGFGPTNPSVAPGELAAGVSRLTNPVTIVIGGITLAPADLLYAGLSPGSISGLYQFNVRIPASAPAGDVPVTITIGGVETQAVATIPIQP